MFRRNTQTDAELIRDLEATREQLLAAVDKLNGFVERLKEATKDTAEREETMDE